MAMADPAGDGPGSGAAGTGLGDGAFDAVLRWAIFAGACCLGVAILWDYGYLGYLFAVDRSRISVLIVALFLAYSFYCLVLLIRLGRELRAALAAERLLARPGARLDDRQMPGAPLVGGYLRDVAAKLARDPAGDRQVLAQAFAAGLRAPARAGVFAADVLYKLGMLGTVIGFVIMLTSMEGMQSLDVDALRAALQQMTGGMAIALLTTIAGLVCGILLRVQFNLAEALAARVVRTAVRVSEIALVPGTKAGG